MGINIRSPKEGTVVGRAIPIEIQITFSHAGMEEHYAGRSYICFSTVLEDARGKGASGPPYACHLLASQSNAPIMFVAVEPGPKALVAAITDPETHVHERR